jgi:hypothetical protein
LHIEKTHYIYIHFEITKNCFVDMEDNTQQQGLQLELNPEVAQGKYVNLALISHSSSEFVLDFTSILPGIPKPQVVSRVVMAPEHAKRLLMALQENIYKYEQQFGKIQLPEMAGRTIAPFEGTKGEA